MKLTDFNLELLKPENNDEQIINDLIVKNKTHSVYGWHYSVDYRIILQRSQHFLDNPNSTILDIGCGPNLNILHSYIENYKKINVEGIDFVGKNPKIEYNYNFNQLNADKQYDLIIAVSSLEHQKDLKDFETSLFNVYEHLNTSGLALITLSVNINSTNNLWLNETNGWVFGVDYLNKIFGTNFSLENVNEVVNSFNLSDHIKNNYYKRFGKNDLRYPLYIPLLIWIKK